MTAAYNFLASWQLFPERCNFQHGIPPKSGNYRIAATDDQLALTISSNWVSLDDEAFFTQYNIIPDGEPQPFQDITMADTIVAKIGNSSTLHISFTKAGNTILDVLHEIMPNGYLRITQQGFTAEGVTFCNVEVYHKQLSVLPYASSVAGVAIRPTQEGMIKHHALSAMEEQTNLQLDQIRQQIELLARQAQDIRKRKELSMMIYHSKLSFKPQIGQTYHLYEKKDGTHTLSMVAPKEWGGAGPFKTFISSMRLLADHTWVEVND